MIFAKYKKNPWRGTWVKFVVINLKHKQNYKEWDPEKRAWVFRDLSGSDLFNWHLSQPKIIFKWALTIHPYHVVDRSPWPFTLSVSLLLSALFLNIIFYKLYFPFWVFVYRAAYFGFLSTLLFWFRDIIVEGTYLGLHTSKVQLSLRLGGVLFIVSEIMFFFSFFWSYLHCSLIPSIWLGGFWPPKGIQAVNPYGIPLLNTLALITSGATVTWAHKALLLGVRSEVFCGLLWTIFYGFFFSQLQLIEYKWAPFSIADSVYGSLFFVLTGFHGLHVLIGTFMLFISFIRHIKYHLYADQHVGFEFAIWYWHFVDVVWLALYVLVYVFPYN